MQNTVQKIPSEFAQLELLAERAETQRDEYSVAELRTFNKEHPAVFNLAKGLSSEVQEKLLTYIASGSREMKAKLQDEMNELKNQIIGTNNTNILDRLMCEEVTTSFLFTRYIDTVVTRHFHHLSSLDIRKADYASVRFNRAVNTLQKLRRALPEINLTQYNVNSA